MFLPRHCVVCRRCGTPLCEGCAARLEPPPEAPSWPELTRAVALFAYEGAGRTVIARLKYENHRDIIGPFAPMLAAAVDVPVDLVTWVPTSPARRRGRGFDQAELLARAVARSLGVPARSTVRRADRRSQIGQGREGRLAARFAAVRPVAGQVVAVVDDVRTTGASLLGVAVALRAAGAVDVIGATLAATPRTPRGTALFSADHPLQSG